MGFSAAFQMPKLIDWILANDFWFLLFCCFMFMVLLLAYALTLVNGEFIIDQCVVNYANFEMTRILNTSSITIIQFSVGGSMQIGTLFSPSSFSSSFSLDDHNWCYLLIWIDIDWYVQFVMLILSVNVKYSSQSSGSIIPSLSPKMMHSWMCRHIQSVDFFVHSSR